MPRNLYHPPAVLNRVCVTLAFSDGGGHSRPENYRGYYMGVSDKNDAMTSNWQRILPEIAEQTSENDALALSVLNEIHMAIMKAEDGQFRKDFPSIKRTLPRREGAWLIVPKTGGSS